MSLLPNRPDITLDGVALRYRAAAGENKQTARRVVAHHFCVSESDAQFLVGKVFEARMSTEPLDWTTPAGKPDRSERTEVGT